MVEQEPFESPLTFDQESPPNLSKDALLRIHTTKEHDDVESVTIIRKRKERNESTGSVEQERKVVRSNNDDGLDDVDHVDKVDHVKQNSTFADNNTIESVIESTTTVIEATALVCFYDDGQKYDNSSSPVQSIRLHSPGRLSPHRDPRLKTVSLARHEDEDDVDHEKRRHSERLSRSNNLRHNRRSSQSSHLSRKKKPKTSQKHSTSLINNSHLVDVCNNKNNATNNNQINSQINETVDDSQHQHQQVASDTLDLTSLHRQIDCSEPVPSCSTGVWEENAETLPGASVASSRLLLSPRNSIISSHRIYLDPEIPRTASTTSLNPLEQRSRQIHKQIGSIKRKLKRFEDDFEQKNAYRPSHADKMHDKHVKKWITDLQRLRKEQKLLKDDPFSVMCLAAGRFQQQHQHHHQQQQQQPPPTQDDTNRNLKIKEAVIEMEKGLEEKRTSCKRSENIDEMNADELVEEKIAVQKALLYFESMFGRPGNKEDRDLVRSLYDRYRTLKRLVARANFMAKSNASTQELATIHEHETMNFVSSTAIDSPTTTTTTTVTSSSSSTQQELSLPVTDSSDTDTSINENLHSLPLEDLQQQLIIAQEEKKRLRRSLKEYENEFSTRTGRRLQKDDRQPMENTYFAYKQLKAKIRLLEALISKHN